MSTRSLSLPLVALIVLLSGAVTMADEGMWPLYDLNKLPFDSLKARGLTLTPEQIYNPAGGGLSDAVVQVGATGSFVSPQGLIVTNHHVAFGAIQQQSTVEHNYLRDGFYAATHEQEIPALGYHIYLTQSISDVTSKVVAGLNDKMTDLERYQTIDMNTKKLIKECEKNPDYKCRVARMFGGRQYMLYAYFEIRDVRIVYVPPLAIGNFGGDIDNWMWPRHTGDFSFMRAYVAPDGHAADFAKENVPFHPKVYLPISGAGIHEGDFAMTLGFPGSTERYLSSYEVADQINNDYPRNIRTRQDILKIMDDAAAKDSAIALRLSSDNQGLNNGLKNSQGTLEGFQKSDILGKKRETERQLVEFLKAHPDLDKQYGQVLPTIDSLYKASKAFDQKDYILSSMSWQCDYLSMASRLYKRSIERAKPDLQRERGYQDRDSAQARERMKDAQINLVPSVDRDIFKYFIKKALALPQGQRIAAIDKLFAGKSGDDLDKYLDGYIADLYNRSKVGDLDTRMKMFSMSKAELEKLNDPFVNLAIALRPDQDEQLQRSKIFSGAMTRLSPKLIQALAEWKNGKMYPDANGTMRLSYGQVAGYNPKDAESRFYATTLKGVIEKESDQDPFVVPAELKKAYLANDYPDHLDATTKQVPVDFLTTNDITGGNSGSPVINGKGEMIGLAFDGNWEGVASDYLFNPEVTRTIAVDIRYVLFLIEHVYHLQNLLKELTVH